MTPDARARAIEAGIKAALKIDIFDTKAIVAAVLDAVEPIIRADERGRVHATIQAGEIPASLYEEMVHDLLADLRAKAMNLPYRIELDEAGNEVTWMRYADVLALLDEVQPQEES